MHNAAISHVSGRFLRNPRFVFFLVTNLTYDEHIEVGTPWFYRNRGQAPAPRRQVSLLSCPCTWRSWPFPPAASAWQLLSTLYQSRGIWSQSHAEREANRILSQGEGDSDQTYSVVFAILTEVVELQPSWTTYDPQTFQKSARTQKFVSIIHQSSSSLGQKRKEGDTHHTPRKNKHAAPTSKPADSKFFRAGYLQLFQ
jgi:hypothetical protein